jgi:hypothetical protein
MRATLRTSFHRAGLCCAALAASAGFAACADALHLDPPGALPGGNDAGQEGGGACRSNPDCSLPDPVCDTVTARCVECLVISDCAAKPGTECSAGACVCPNPGNPAMPLTYCGGAAPACVDTTTSADNCGACGNACFVCAAGKCANAWTPTSTKGAPGARSHHVAVWTGTQMFVWGGKDASGSPLTTGGLYDPAKKTWTPTSAPTGAARYDATAVWDDADKLVLIWGGRTAPNSYLGDGLAYDPAKDTWSALCPSGTAPSPRADHSAVWANPQPGISGITPGLIIWGGTGPKDLLNDGAVCDPGSSNAWVATIASPSSTSPGPSARAFHTATWDSGSRMIIFGGVTSAPMTLDDTWAYAPSMPPAMWTSLGVQTKRYQHTANWDPASATTIIFGGWDGTTYFGDAAALSGSSWTAFGGAGPNPEGRIDHTAVVLTTSTTSQLVVFGGQGQGGLLAAGWSLDTSKGGWSALPTPGPSARMHHTAVAGGAMMIVWGGDTASGPTNTGAVYTAQ